MGVENEISNIESAKVDDNIILKDSKSGEIIPLFRSKKFIFNTISFTNFIKNVEQQVHTSNEYKAYIKYLKCDIDPRLNHCMVYSNITDEEAPIDMHHHIFTLYDTIEIITTKFFKTDTQFSSSRIFHEVMEEHRHHRVLVVMLCRAVHEAVHNVKNPRFIDYRMGHGDIVSFIEKYWDCLSIRHINKIRKYVEEYEKNLNEKPSCASWFEEVITRWCREV